MHGVGGVVVGDDALPVRHGERLVLQAVEVVAVRLVEGLGELGLTGVEGGGIGAGHDVLLFLS